MSDSTEAFVLVHGAHHGKWVWDSIVPYLELPAVALDLPGRGVPDDLRSLTIANCAEDLIAQMRDARLRRVTLVGHSLAGSVAWTAAAMAPDLVVGLVGIAAVFPPPGKRVTDLWPTGLRWLPRAMLAARRGGPNEPLSLSERNARRRLTNDLDSERASWLIARLGPEAVGLSTSRVPQLQLSPALYRGYVLCLRDRALAPARQRVQASQINAPIVEIPTGHDPMVSAPAVLARVLNDVVAGWVR